MKNTWTGIGNIGVMKFRKVGQKQMSSLFISLAINDFVPSKEQPGTYEKHTDWVSFSLWGKNADSIQKYAKKGSTLLVEGKLNTFDYLDKDTGKKVYKLQVSNAFAKIISGWVKDGGAKGTESKPGTSEEDDLPF